MKNYVDVKVSVWNRLLFDNDADMNKILSIIQKGRIAAVTNDEFGFIKTHTLYETEKELTPEENSSDATIEIYENGKLMWDNTNTSLGI